MRMEQLTALIHNFNIDCHKQFTNVSPLLEDMLDDSLKEIERFFYSSFWINRFRRRMDEEEEDYLPIQLDIILGVSTDLRDSTKFKIFNEDESSNGISNKDNMIALNTNMSKEKLNDSHINNIIMHEFGHRQYNQKVFRLVVELNKRIISSPEQFIKDTEVLNREDYKYFTNHNELRQRIIPIVKEMYDNCWTLGETYNKSKNLEIDDIKNIFTREYILKLIDNIL